MNNRLLPLIILILALGACHREVPKPKQDLSRILTIDARFTAGDYQQAQEELLKYTADYPGCELGWSLLGWTHAKLDDIDTATECFNKAITLNPKYDNAFVGLGAVRRRAGDLEGARKAYAEATRITPENAEALASLLVIEILEHNYQAAVDCGEKSWALRKDLPSIPANLSVAYYYLKDEEKKLYYYEQAKKLGYHQLESLDQIFNGTMTIESPKKEAP